MSQRGRKNSHYDEPTGGGNVLFTLGLVSVVALLVVGYIMTKGGFNSIAKNGFQTISLTTPTPVESGVTPAVQATPGPAFDEIVRKYEKEMSQQKEFYENQIKQLRDTYESQITDLNTRIQLLELSNNSLRAKNK